MEILIILAVILIVIIAKFGSMKDKIDVLRRSNSSLSESLTKARQECDSVRAKLAQKTRESEAALAQKTRESNAIIARKNREHNELARTLESVRADNTNMLRLISQLKQYLGLVDSIKQDLNLANHRLDNMTSEYKELTGAIEALRAENTTLRKSLSEAPLGFPSLLEALSQYDFQHDKRIAYWLETKPHPAFTAAQTVKTETRKRRDAELEARKAKILLDYYFSIFPDAQEYNEASAEQSTSEIEASSLDKNENIAGRYLSREEYSRLSVTQRNQLALDRFWSRKKSKHLIGRLYEQYIGWLYEHNGWLVEYFGISEGFSDLGRDLICHKDNTTLIIQCKNWSKSKRIYEKHIFQLFGTAYEYMKNNPFENVRAVFFTSTQLSDLARSFAKEFRIELHEGFELKHFPIIKCNIGREGEKIYHLPFDQQYYILHHQNQP